MSIELEQRFAWNRGVLSLIAVCSLLLSANVCWGQTKFTASQIEFFERSVRPLLAARCYKCHSGKSKSLKGGLRLDSRAALLKGGIMATFGLFVLGQKLYRIAIPRIPMFEAMGAVGVLALAANSLCLVLLWRHRADDINMSSVWLCSRNDIIANVAVLFAALGVRLTGLGWPDILVGLALSALFLRSALFVLRGAMTGLREANA